MAIQNSTPIFGDLANDIAVASGTDGIYFLTVDFATNPISTGGNQLRILDGAALDEVSVLAVEVTKALSTTFQLGDGTDPDEVVTTANGTAAVGSKTITKQTLSAVGDDLLLTADTVAMTEGRLVIQVKLLAPRTNKDLGVHREYATPA